MYDSHDQQRVILKEAHDSQSFNAEVNALDGYLRGHGSFRQLVNIIPDQKIMIYEYLADNLHNVLYMRPQRKLEVYYEPSLSMSSQPTMDLLKPDYRRQIRQYRRSCRARAIGGGHAHGRAQARTPEHYL